MNALENKAREGRINEDASIRDRQSVIINAPIEKVWEILTNVNDWPKWNKEIKSAKCEKVALGAHFEWHIRLSNFKSTFQVVDKPNLLVWTGKSKLVKSIFVWNLEATDTQTILTVEESLEGFIVPIFNNQSKLHDILLDWIHALKASAENA
jgi:uncharacterized protein YndB with AHSA1/START domain